ncbi:MAG: hypothetical protein QOK44_5056 [Betaproteobacteria bacterium]|nr:hypothetical protein [Betaproteobacteria bacterium]
MNLGTSNAETADWDFFADKEGNWHWRSYRPAGAQAESRDSFESRTDCIADAMRHGYLAREPGCQPETQATELY